MSKFKNDERLNKKVLIIILTGFFAIAIVFALGIYLNNNISSSSKNETTENSQIEKVDRSLSGLSVKENRKEMLNNTSELLNLTRVIDKDDNKTDTDEASDAVDNLSLDDFEMDKINKLVDFDGYSDEDKITVLQTLSTFSYLLDDASENPIVPVMAEDSIELKNDLGFGFVPLSIYTGDNNTFSLMFAWENDSWRLIPYPLLEQVKIASLI